MKPEIYNYQLNQSLPFKIDYPSTEAFYQPRNLDLHHAVHLGFILSGEHVGRLGAHEFVLRPGEVYLTGLWEAHGSLRSSEGYIIRLITVDPDVLASHFFHASDRLNLLLMLPSLKRIALVRNCGLGNYALQYEALFASDAADSDGLLPERRYLAIVDLFIYLLGHIELPPAAAQSGVLFQRLLPGIQLTASIPDRRVTAAEAAAVCGLSVGRFEHLWHDYFGIGFGRYELENRFVRAVNALAGGRLTVKEVAAQWGFSDENHFARHFKTRYHMSPVRYFSRSKSI